MQPQALFLAHEKTEIKFSNMPDSQEVARYEMILPGAAKRIFDSAERRQIHVENMEIDIFEVNKEVLKKGQALQFIGLISRVIFSFACLGSVVYLAYLGKPIGTISAAVAGFAPFLEHLYASRKQPPKE